MSSIQTDSTVTVIAVIAILNQYLGGGEERREEELRRAFKLWLHRRKEKAGKTGWIGAEQIHNTVVRTARTT